MFGAVIRLLQSDSWRHVSEEVEIAKGKYQYAKSWKVFIRKLRRL